MCLDFRLETELVSGMRNVLVMTDMCSFKDSRRRLSQHEYPQPVQRKTVCSLHPLSPSDLTHLNALAATGISTPASKSASASVSAAGSNRSSPGGTPIPSPAPSPVPSRDPSPCHHYLPINQNFEPPPNKGDLFDNPPAESSSSSRLRDYSPPKVIFPSEQSNEGDSLGLLSGRILPSTHYLDNPDEDCSNASTLGDVSSFIYLFVISHQQVNNNIPHFDLLEIIGTWASGQLFWDFQFR
jgi:hypothetical protein